jgi:hypothetical protein
LKSWFVNQSFLPLCGSLNDGVKVMIPLITAHSFFF